MVANIMNPDQTAPEGEVWSGLILFAVFDFRMHKQTRVQMTIVVISGNHVKCLLFTLTLQAQIL